LALSNFTFAENSFMKQQDERLFGSETVFTEEECILLDALSKMGATKVLNDVFEFTEKDIQLVTTTISEKLNKGKTFNDLVAVLRDYRYIRIAKRIALYYQNYEKAAMLRDREKHIVNVFGLELLWNKCRSLRQ